MIPDYKTAQELREILSVAARFGLVPSEVKFGDFSIVLLPKDLPAKVEKDAPKELPESFDDLPVPNWLDPADQKDTKENRKRALAAQEAADKEVFGESIPAPDQ